MKYDEPKCPSCNHRLDDAHYFDRLSRMVNMNDISKSYAALQKLKNIEGPDVLPLLEKMHRQAELADYPYKYLDELRDEVGEELRKRKSS